MQAPLFSILHTSARPEKWREIYGAWIAAAIHPEQVEYVLCVDERWGFNRTAFDFLQQFTETEPRFKVVWNESRRCYVDGVNTAAKASTGRILIVNADDQYPCPGWDAQLRAVLWKAGYILDAPEFDGCECVIEASTGTPDEHERGILVMPILSRARYERLGYIFYPEYESMFADNEFCEHARQDGVIIDARHLLFPHRHPLFDLSAQKPGVPWNETDEAYKAQNNPEAFGLGKRIFEYRRQIRFGQVLDEAEHIQGWMNRGELEWLSRAAFECGSAIEVGSWKGRSTYAIAHSCTGPVHAIDTWEGSPELPEMQKQAAAESVFEEFSRNLRDRVIHHRGESHLLAAEVPDAGLVFIDGGHTYEQVKADLLAYMGKATKMICGHDWPSPEVRQAVIELIGDVQTIPGTRLWYYRLPEGAQFEVKRRQQRTLALCLSGELMHWEWVQALLNLHQHLGRLGFQVWIAHEFTSNVYVTREQIRKVMMQADPRPELFLWLDDDNPAPTPEQFDLLLKDLDERSDVDGVTAWCWIYNVEQKTFYPSVGMWSPDNLHWRPFDPAVFPTEREPRPVEASGFPCFLMRYSALEKAGNRPFLPILDDLMDHGIAGEDHAFCHRAQAGGAKFLVEPRVRVKHLKWCDAVPDVPRVSVDPKIAVMMRVKNEARWIERCINSVIPLAGENVYVMDDESTDNTLELARATGVNVFSDPFAGQPLDETRDKDWLLTQVRNACDPDWVLCIDGDEELEPGGAEKLRRILSTNPPVDVFALGFLFCWDAPDQIRVDGRYASMQRESLFRPKSGITFKSYYEGKDSGDPKCHVGLHCGNAPNGRGELVIKPLAVFLLHYGYLFKEDRIRKYNWYRSIDPDNPYEDNYRHIVLGDLPELPAGMKVEFGGPLRIVKLPESIVPKFDLLPEPLQDEVTA